MKMNALKRAAALLLALALLLAVLPQTASTAHAEDACSGVCGEELTWTFDPASGVLAIAGEGDMWDFWLDDEYGSDTAVPWLAFLDQITALELPEGLTSIGDYAFMDCLHLQAAVIPETVTDIGWCAFKSCSDLSELVLPEGVLGISLYAFSFCTSLSEVVFPRSLNDLESEAFASCTGLTAVTFLNPCCCLSNSCLSGCGEVTIYGYNNSTAERFAEAQGLPFVSLGDLTAEGVCGDALTWSFSYSTGILTIEGEGDMWGFMNFKGDGYVSDQQPWNTYKGVITGLSLPEGLTSIGDAAFNGCSNLKSAVIPETVTYIGDYAFGACSELCEVAIPEGVTSIGESAFTFCGSLPEAVLPASVKTVGAYAFSFCFSLKTITFLNPKCFIASDCLDRTENVTVRGYSGSTAESFAADCGLRFLPLGDFIEEGVCGDNLTWSFDSVTGLLTIEGSGDMWDYGYWYLAPWYNYTSIITAVSLPAGITGVGAYAFFRCDNLTEAVIPEGVTSIRNHGFSTCRALSALTLPKSLTFIGEGSIEGCEALTQVTIPDSVTEIDGYAFCCCYNLTSVHFPASLETLGTRAFAGCSALTSAAIPEGVSEIPCEAFSDCYRLVSVTIPDSVTRIGDQAFYYCDRLTSVSLPEGLTEIGEEAFARCFSLKAVTIPAAVTAIDKYAFYRCSDLTSLKLSDGLTYIGSYAFADCWSLSSVAIPASVELIDINAFFDCSSLKSVVFRSPSTWVGYFNSCDYEYWYDPDDSPCTLGVPGFTDVYGKADDPDSETEKTISYWDENYQETITLSYYHPQTYAETYGYTFYETDVFDDVKPGKWYEIPVAWAYGNGITSGTGNGNFSPNQACTREQIVTFIWKAYGSPEAEGAELPFTDVVAGKYYEDAVRWAYHHDPQITGGLNGTTFGVGKPCTRAQVVTFLYAAAGKPEPEATENPFTDVKETDYFYKAVLWAVENGITSGTTPTTFSPKQTCTRAQVVTFLYQAVG